MKERVFEDIIVRYPELIEADLKLLGRQVNVGRKFVDVLFEDKHGQKLIIEMKVGTIVRKHVAQLMDYEGYFLSPDDPTVRVMLVGNRVPKNLQRALDHHGFEWKELSYKHLATFLKNAGDEKLWSLIECGDIEKAGPSTKYVPDNNEALKRNCSSATVTEHGALDTKTRIGRQVKRGGGSIIDIIISSLEAGLSDAAIVEKCMPLYSINHPGKARDAGFRDWVSKRVRAQIYWAKKNVVSLAYSGNRGALDEKK